LYFATGAVAAQMFDVLTRHAPDMQTSSTHASPAEHEMGGDQQLSALHSSIFPPSAQRVVPTLSQVSHSVTHLFRAALYVYPLLQKKHFCDVGQVAVVFILEVVMFILPLVALQCCVVMMPHVYCDDPAVGSYCSIVQ